MNRPRRSPSLRLDPDDTADDYALCPLDNPQRSTECLGYREREPGRLQLRILMADGEGVCSAVADESEPPLVTVQVIACWPEEREHRRYDGIGEERVHVYLQEPLGDRTVIDRETGEALPLYVPTYLNGKPTKAPAFYTDPADAAAGSELLEQADGPQQRHNAPHQLWTLGF